MGAEKCKRNREGLPNGVKTSDGEEEKDEPKVMGPFPKGETLPAGLAPIGAPQPPVTAEPPVPGRDRRGEGLEQFEGRTVRKYKWSTRPTDCHPDLWSMLSQRETCAYS